MTLCSPRTAGRVACPKDRGNRKGQHKHSVSAAHSTLKTMGISANGYSAASYHTVNQDTERNPEDEGKHHD